MATAQIDDAVHNEKAPPSAERRGFRRQADKPDSVVEWPSIWAPRHREARCDQPGSFGRAALERFPIWSCTGRGLPSRPVTRTAGELLPHRFTLARTPEGAVGGLLSVALSVGLRRLDVIQRPALRCPDFPRPVASRAYEKRRDADRPRPPGLPTECTTASTGPRLHGRPMGDHERPSRLGAPQRSGHEAQPAGAAGAGGPGDPPLRTGRRCSARSRRPRRAARSPSRARARPPERGRRRGPAGPRAPRRSCPPWRRR